MVAAAEFPIAVVIDPTESAAGARAVEKQLASIEREADELSKTLRDALTLREGGTSAAFDEVSDNAREAQRSVRGLTVEQQRLVENIRRQEAVEAQRLALTRAASRERVAAERAVAVEAAKSQQRVREELTKTRTQVSGLGGILNTALAGFGVAVAARGFAQLSDTLTNTENRLRLVTSSAAELASVQQQLFSISERTRSSFSGTAEIFNRLAVSGKELGVSNSQLLDFTESLNQAIILSGASAQEAQAGLIQLSQGLASGTLRGDELRSVLEQLPAVADVIAKGLKVTRGELRGLGEDGKITSKQVLDAFAAARGELNDRFATTIPTIGQAFTVLGTKVTEAVGRFNEATGASKLVAEGLILVGNNATALIATATGLAVAFSAVKVVGFIAGLKAVEAQTLKTAGVLGALTVTVGALGSIYQSVADDQAGAAEALRNLQEDTKVVPKFAAQITDLQRTISALKREAATKPTAELSDEIEVLSRRLTFFQEELKRTATEQIASANAAKDAAAATAAARKLNEEATARQAKVLDDIRKPFADYVQLQKDLGVLLAANKITQDEFNETLSKAKPPEPPKAAKPVEAAAPLDPFAEQLKSLREQNTELEIRANNLGIQREALLIEAELASRGVKLNAEQQAQLASALIKRKELTEQTKTQADNEERLAQAQKDQEGRIERLREQVDVNAEINQQLEDLNILREREAALIPQIDQAVEALRLRQLEGSRELGDGFERALLRIKAEAEDLATVGEGIVNVFADTATDAIVEFARTGTFQFKEFASSILADITRIIARLLVVQALNAAIGAFGGGAAVPLATTAVNAGRARGGTVQPGMAPFPVGEDGPEMFVPNRTGTIVPNPSTNAQPAQPVTVQVVNVQDPNAVPQAIADGSADDAIVNVLSRKKDVLRQLLA